MRFWRSTGLISQGYWEASKWYFVNVERGNIADKLQPRNINVSFTNNSNVAIDQLYCYDNIIILYAFDHGRVGGKTKGFIKTKSLGWMGRWVGGV